MGAAATFFVVRNEYKLGIRQAQFLYWERTTRQTYSATGWKQLFKAFQPVAKPALPNFGGSSEFYDNCLVLRAELFQNTIDHLPPLTPN